MIGRRRLLAGISTGALLLPNKARAFLLGGMGPISHSVSDYTSDYYTDYYGGTIGYDDGATGAPPGTVQYPTLLNTYGGFNARRLDQPNFQPPWRVAGVDYHVGVSSAVTLTPVVNGSGVLSPLFPGTLDPSNAVIDVTAGGATVSGWDFSVHGGYTLNLRGTCVIQNCKWITGTNNSPGQAAIIVNPGPLVSVTMTNCSIDGNAVDQSGTGGGLVSLNAPSGNILVQYCHIRNAWSELFQVGLDGNVNSIICKYNVFENAGLGTRIPAEQVHGDWAQIFGGTHSPPSQLQTGILNFNLFWQNLPKAQASTQGWNWMCASTNAAYINSMDMSNNTAITVSGADVNDMLMINTTWLGTPTTNGTGTAYSNYVAMVGGQTDFGSTVWGLFGNNNGGPGGVGPRTTKVQLHGNIDMDTGGAAPNPDPASNPGWINV